ncbi:MAG TPA: cupin domain-containing protein [Paludibacteraceae bacterium]|nr:cupin domain-containing protein [Paludibacteraceae bacterium]
MKKMSYNNQETTKNPHGVDARKLHSNDDVQVVHILLKPGENLKKHTTAVNVFFYVLEGEGVIEIGDEKVSATKDWLIDSPKNIPHALYNESKSDFRVLVVKTPSPTAKQNREAVEQILKQKK